MYLLGRAIADVAILRESARCAIYCHLLYAGDLGHVVHTVVHMRTWRLII
jgi:hypothetical protein